MDLVFRVIQIAKNDSAGWAGLCAGRLVLIFGDFVGTVSRSDFLIDIDTEDEYFRKFEGQRIQALSLPVKSRNLSTLLGELEVCFQRGWELKDAGKWTSADFDQVFELSQQINSEILSLRGEE